MYYNGIMPKNYKKLIRMVGFLIDMIRKEASYYITLFAINFFEG